MGYPGFLGGGFDPSGSCTPHLGAPPQTPAYFLA